MNSYETTLPDLEMAGSGPAFGPIDVSVRLIVFTPINHGNQVVRGYRYMFNENVLDLFSESASSINAMREIRNPQNIDINTSILPDAHGMQLDTTSLDEMYSFVLIISDSHPMRSRFIQGPKQRIVITGYFVDTPIIKSVLDGKLVSNDNAIMVFTHAESVLLNTGYGPSGAAPLRVQNSMDYVPNMAAQLATGNEDLLFCDYVALSKTDDFTHNDTFLPGTKRNNAVSLPDSSRPIDEFMKSPKHQLGGIMDSIHIGFAEAEANTMLNGASIDTINDIDIDDISVDVLQMSNIQKEFLLNVQKYMSNDSIPNIHKGMNPATPMSMRAFKDMFPSAEVIPVEVPVYIARDYINQLDTNKRTIYSSLVENVVAGICNSIGIVTIAFRYDSYAGEMGKRGTWYIKPHSVALMAVTEDNKKSTKAAVIKFRKLFEENLVPILQLIGGDFMVQVKFDMVTSTIVDLNFLDEGRPEEGWYVKPNRLGGLVNPTLGLSDLSGSNEMQLASLYNELAASAALPEMKEYNNELFREI